EADLLKGTDAPANGMWVEQLDLSKMSQGYGTSQAAHSIVGKPITLKGVVYPHGVGTHADGALVIDLKGAAERFIAMAGVDDETAGKGSVTFEVWVGDTLAASTGTLHGGDAPKLLSVDLRGAQQLTLETTDAGDGNGFDHSDWGGALLLLKPGATARPESLATAVATDDAPKIAPFTGEAPLTYAADNLPPGLTLDPGTGVVSGALLDIGATQVKLTVRNAKGEASRTLTIVGGERKLALTPPMGWNSWYVWGPMITDAQMRAAADAMVSSGLAAHGYQYVNIDDGWEAGRDAEGNIQTNDRFPGMRSLGDYIHERGLKFGIYTSPGPKTCGGYTGSYQHEAQDIRAYAEWGVDFVKYDWCSYGGLAKNNSLEEMIKPYRYLQTALEACNRDMVYSLCQYGMGDVWKWGADVNGNLWRTTGDSGDTWGIMASIGFKQDGLEKCAGPGRWNDPDMIQAGMLGMAAAPRPTHLAPNEQVTQITLWAIIAAPLLLSCDLTQLGAFEKALLMNEEVIEINQDVLGKQGNRRAKDGRTEVWARPLSDGTFAVGLFNRGVAKKEVTARWSDLGLEGKQPVRDVWQHKDLGECADAFKAEVPGHGAVLLKLGAP
ncbi:MAG: NPCBM/NEW2 domain-containing protein, partial [Candidatus Hydrogenedentes bacterium]|nr:NPCBM/NEW2 domain-containing protein [Candidatus Hydrogenedentota bacterium]